jgi:hypothetical protein
MDHHTQRLPIRKNVFWDDLGVARKIYRNLAILQMADGEESSNDENLEDAIQDDVDAILDEGDEEGAEPQPRGAEAV